jgi:hypothetical protein
MAPTTGKNVNEDLIYKKSNEPWIGGPGTMLPWFVESCLSWSVALSMLGVSGYHYLRTIYILPFFNRLRYRFKLQIGLYGDSCKHDKELECWLELTTSSRAEKEARNDRYQQFIDYLTHTSGKMSSWTNEEMLQILRSSDVARRLVSLALRPNQQNTSDGDSLQLKRLWRQLLRLPPPDDASKFTFDISVIIPAYRERGTDVRFKLVRALNACKDPARVEVIVVDAGECIALDENVQDMSTVWGSLKLVTFTSGGGRGPCLNYGASQASGRIFAFVHSDTTLPPHWDCKIVLALEAQPCGVRANSCAFSFGIDTSLEGLNGAPYPPGIKAVETTANWRTQMYSLPYGDQTLSVPAVIFRYLGGFPDQCLMEDYELISLLRRRAALTPKFGIEERERLVIIGGTPAYCSPRRWQKFGVLYVTYMNSKVVNLYAGGMTPDKLFLQYYGRPPPERTSNVAPWEVELEKLILDGI